ncbi:hypothetical protein TBLA_0D00570 [Henningerozyma blattae CBS 6284]|uniref:Nucleoporin Nup133/Nup155-like N-terminal domain-containing protein n=1 Tax=Henningerozyma blattae (strain ATCC 34711 / CBS 6284 / DSM 70876 / NBRC 10599 / NRRL Y-10934 / UCD 77-7) TaxID=1071380 RepID=I2H2G2_HENB6|nr:hypothetical protein TBLA_0D00570 [Tetrapisispora blattae CBS 6284]CCH60564.1 hypothetical protein TBLA_0D00570 [Tetrapisispora blattae CBS 6284]
MYSTPLKSRIHYDNNSTFAASHSLGGTNKKDPSIAPSFNNDYTTKKPSTNSFLPNLSISNALLSNPTTSILSSNLNNTTASTSSNNNTHLHISNIANLNPLDLASQYIDHLERQDAHCPILDERSYYNNGVNYNFSREVGGLGAFTPFERQKVVNIPDDILQEVSKAEIKSDVGIFPEIDRCWFTIDNKLILWNINDNTDFQSIDEIKHTILKVKLVIPKPNTFVDHINYLLLITTPFDIFILALSSNKLTSELKVFNTGMSVPVHGIDVSEIICYEKTGQIFFSGKSNGMNVWELQYSSTDDWFNTKCTKSCLTQSTLSNLLPTNLFAKLPGSGLVQSLFEDDSSYLQETIIQLTIDQSRGIIYSLSSKSTIRAYLINGSHLETPLSIPTSYIKRIIGTTTARGAAILGDKYLKFTKIISVSQQENNNLFLVAITLGGVRLYFNGSVGRHNIEALRLESIKFPPSAATQEAMQEELEKQQNDIQKKNLPLYTSLSSSQSVMLKFQKRSAVLLNTTNACTVISPGIFFSSVEKDRHEAHNKKTITSNAGNTSSNSDGYIATTQATSPLHAHKNANTIHRLFVSVPDYGVLKNHGKYVENATFLDTNSPIKEITALNKYSPASLKPEGYSNAFATQYSSEQLKIAVLTTTSIEIYRYRTPDEVFESLIGNPLPFLLNYGLAEACSTALFVACKSNKSDALRSSALTFFTVGIPGIIEIKPRYNRYTLSNVSSLLSKASCDTATPQKSFLGSSSNKFDSESNLNLDDVFLSPRFYGIALLITRLFRDIWDKEIFSQYIKPTNSQFLSTSSIIKRDDNNLISKISISKSFVEYYLSSVAILNEFFDVYGTSLTTMYSPSLASTKFSDKSEDVANQAENIALNSLIKLIQSIKEALSFLNVLYEESEVEGLENQSVTFKDIIKFINPEIQRELLKLKFKDIFALKEGSKLLIREILASIINRNINRGVSIEYTATALQERCGSFCSSVDILGFRASEHLRKAKEIGLRDIETLSYHLNNAIKLYEKIVDDLSIEKLKDAVNTMLELNYFPKTIQFLLNIANAIDKGKLAYQYVSDGYLKDDERKIYYDKRLMIYDLVFDALVKVDASSLSYKTNTNSNINPATNSTINAKTNTNKAFSFANEMELLRQESYEYALTYNDQLFHYKLYDWLVSQKQQDKLLQLKTDYILPYLEEKSKDSLEVSKVLWVYLSRMSKFFEAAEVLYLLSLSDFEIKLNERIEFLSRANGFCNSLSLSNQKSKMIQLGNQIQEIFEVASIQDDILSLIITDNRIETDIKDKLIKELDNKILTVSKLFNEYAIPLGYHEICLLIFQVSNFNNQEEILNEWDELFNSLKKEINIDEDANSTKELENSKNFINLLSNVIIKIGRQVNKSEVVFPIKELIPKIVQIFQSISSHSNYSKSTSNLIKNGSIISIFLSSGISFDKLYYILRELIENNENETSTANSNSSSITNNSNTAIYKNEMVWLIKEWYQYDRKLRDIITFDEINKLIEYNLDNDPIEKYMKSTGNSI